MAFGVTSAESTDLFVGPPDAPLQLVRVAHTGGTSPITVEGDGLTTPEPPSADPAGGVVEVPVEVRDPVPGERRAARVLCEGTSTDFEFTVAEPGWTMYMISHFHYDPVWWNTQAAYTSLWTEEPPGRCQADQRVRPGAPPTSKWRAANRNTSSCSPRSTTSSRTGTPTPRTAPTCAGSSPTAASRSWAAPTTSRTPTSPAPRRRSETSCTASAFSATSWAPTRPPRGSSTCSATTRSSPAWRPTPG